MNSQQRSKATSAPSSRRRKLVSVPSRNSKMLVAEHEQNSNAHIRSLEGLGEFGTILADPPWRFSNRTGKMAPEHKRLHRYQTMSIEEICALPISKIAAEKSHR